jgi:hypothetical protein
VEVEVVLQPEQVVAIQFLVLLLLLAVDGLIEITTTQRYLILMAVLVAAMVAKPIRYMVQEFLAKETEGDLRLQRQ